MACACKNKVVAPTRSVVKKSTTPQIANGRVRPTTRRVIKRNIR